MEISLFAFAGAGDTFGFTNRVVPCDPAETPLDIARRLVPGIDTTNLRVALDHEFVTWETAVGSARELAFIPPVSGG